MYEQVDKERMERLFALMDTYMSLGEYGQETMAQNYPHIDFKRLANDEQFLQMWKPQRVEKVEPKTAPTFTPTNNSSSEIDWTKILEVVAGVLFVVSFIGGIILAISLADSAGGVVAFVVFLAIAVNAFIVLAVVMVFLQMAKDISSTAKDTAKMKEILLKRER